MEIETTGLQIEFSDAENDDIQFIQQQLVKHVEKHAGPSSFRQLTLTIRDEGGPLIAGLNGQSNWQWLFVKMVWVAEGHRYKGLGSRLLEAAEREARRRGCSGVWLDTFSFQSPDFYKRHGFKEFGKIDNYPFGHSRHFFAKKF